MLLWVRTDLTETTGITPICTITREHYCTQRDGCIKLRFKSHRSWPDFETGLINYLSWITLIALMRGPLQFTVISPGGNVELALTDSTFFAVAPNQSLSASKETLVRFPPLINNCIWHELQLYPRQPARQSSGLVGGGTSVEEKTQHVPNPKNKSSVSPALK